LHTEVKKDKIESKQILFSKIESKWKSDNEEAYVLLSAGHSKTINQVLAACDSPKFWLQLWADYGKLRSGVVNAVRIYTKCKFSKAIAQHKANEIARSSEIVDNSPPAVWRLRAKNKSSNDPPCMPEKDCCDYFRDQFSAPNSYLENTFCQALDKELQFAVKDIGFQVTSSLMRSKIGNIKKKEI